MSFELGLVVLAIFTGLMLIFFGYVIGIEKKMSIFESYNQLKIKDKDKLAVFAGRYMILIGFYTFITPFLVKMFGKMMAFLYPVVVIAILAVMISGVKKI
ncbi:MAG: hypothetical protein ACE5J5_05610 [Candidatus Hydrothermarchaeales archaeon]